MIQFEVSPPRLPAPAAVSRCLVACGCCVGFRGGGELGWALCRRWRPGGFGELCHIARAMVLEGDKAAVVSSVVGFCL